MPPASAAPTTCSAAPTQGRGRGAGARRGRQSAADGAGRAGGGPRSHSYLHLDACNTRIALLSSPLFMQHQQAHATHTVHDACTFIYNAPPVYA